MENVTWIANLVLLIDLAIRAMLALRIIMRRHPVGVTFAWLVIVLSVPIFGAIIYLTFGELRLGNRRADWAKKIHAPYESWLTLLQQQHPVDLESLGPVCEPLSKLSQSVFAIPALPGNRLQLLPEFEAVFEALIADIDAAKSTCHLEFYIWAAGGYADQVLDALLRAVERGVVCRVLIDSVGSRPFLRSELAQKMRDGGIHLQAALPVGLFRMLFVRFDLRLHRKIVVIDGETAYTGSLNLVDPRYFKQDAGVGEWVDAMVRVEGPVVNSLSVTFLEDWELETGEGLDNLRHSVDVHFLESVGDAVVQTVPSGPVFESKAVLDVLLMTIYAARRELILTSPYFVPDPVLVTALATAARRGVEVTLIIPAKVDSFLVRHASQAYLTDLLTAGVKVARFEGGLLHTKSVTVDGVCSLFGSLNLDPRSLHLNFEITLAIYDDGATENIRALQLSYLDDSHLMDLAVWEKRSAYTRLLGNTMRLLGPLL